MKFRVDTMTCGGCAQSLTKAIKTIDSSAEVWADLSSRTVEIRSVKSVETLAQALADAGYPAVAA